MASRIREGGSLLQPAVLAALLAVDLLLSRRDQSSIIGLMSIAGTTILFIGGMVWVFVNPALFGTGFIISTVGVVVVGAALLATICYSVAGHLQAAPRELTTAPLARLVPKTTH